MRGRFVTFEGTEGCGKSTQIERLEARLRAAGIDVVVTREPGGTTLGRELRAVLLAPRDPPPSAYTELLLYVADRAQHLTELVQPALDLGRSVLCDRYLDATLAYQGHARGLGADAVLALHRLGPLGLRPDRTLLLDLAPEHGLLRAQTRNAAAGPVFREGRLDDETLEFHRRVRAGYHALARAEPARIAVVDASGTVDVVERRVALALAEIWPVLGGGA